MAKRLSSIANDIQDYEVGVEKRLVIPDLKNERGRLWLYVNRHSDNSELLKVLFKLGEPTVTYAVPTGKKKNSVFGYEWVFNAGTGIINKLKRKGFKLD